MSVVPANALSLNKTTLTLDSGEKIILTKSQLDEVVTITQAEAEEVAMSFVNDMITAGTTDWDEQTTITSVVPMYDNSNTDEITAYTVNLDTGYVVVSAYLDAESLIPEWSDKAAPLYKELDIDESDKVIYLGAYEYYADDGTAVVKGLYDEQVQKSELTNLIEDTRDLKHIPDSALKQYNDNDRATTNGPIVDPIGHGNANYAGPFRRTLYLDNWENYLDYYTMDFGEAVGYSQHCTPVAITNVVAAYRNRYGSNNIPNSNDSLFLAVAIRGINLGYYVNGVSSTNRSYYLANILENYSVDYSLTVLTVNSSAGTGGIDSYDTLYNHINSGALMIVSLQDHSYYNDHDVVCSGITRLRSDTTGYYLSYMHLADGWGETKRFITVASALNKLGVCVYF